MKEYQPQTYDVVMFLDLNDCYELKELGIQEKTEYVVSYVFVDGGCVLYRELKRGNGIVDAEEFIIEPENTQHLSFIYSYLESDNSYDDEDYYMDDDGDLAILDKLDVDMYSYKVAHEYEVGDYVYFEDVRVVKFYQEAELENNKPYKITSLSTINNCPFIETNIGDLELYPIEIQYLKLYEGDIYDDMLDRIDVILDEIAEGNKQNIVELTMDKALEDKNYIKAQEIYDKYIKGS